MGTQALYGIVRAGVPSGTEVLVGTPGLEAAAGAADVVLNAVVDSPGSR